MKGLQRSESKNSILENPQTNKKAWKTEEELGTGRW